VGMSLCVSWWVCVRGGWVPARYKPSPNMLMIVLRNAHRRMHPTPSASAQVTPDDFQPVVHGFLNPFLSEEFKRELKAAHPQNLKA
jgi:hypothetical protein